MADIPLPNIPNQQIDLTAVDHIDDIDFSDIVDNSPDVNSSGFFVELMKSIEAMIQEQYCKGRITKADFAQVYMSSIEGALDKALKYAIAEIVTNLEAEKLNAEIHVSVAQAELAKAELEFNNSNGLKSLDWQD